jgi:LEA14-like dessication related protein
MSSGCTTILETLGFGFLEPEFEVRNVQVRNMTYGDINLELEIRVKNPNDFELKIERLTYVAFLDTDAKLAHGTFDQVFAVPAKGNNDAKLPLNIDPGATMKLLSKVLGEKGEHVIQYSAEVTFATPLGSMQRTFTGKKPLKLK